MPTWRIYVFVLVLIAMGVSFAYLRLTGASIPAVPIQAAIEQTMISDAAMLEKANPAFYGGAENGDVVLRYEHRLDLYRPSEQRVIRSVPIGK